VFECQSETAALAFEILEAEHVEVLGTCRSRNRMLRFLISHPDLPAECEQCTDEVPLVVLIVNTQAYGRQRIQRLERFAILTPIRRCPLNDLPDLV
jgi:hypothetical protein